MFRVAKSVALRELTRKSNQVTDIMEEAQLEALQEGDTIEEQVQAQQKVSHYCKAIAELPAQCRRVFLMRKVQGLSHKEIAAQLEVSVGAVEKQMTLGIKRTMQTLEKMEVDSEGFELPAKEEEASHE